ncbi:MAG: Rieske 2Fe-2S domain-containing protein [Candidatus Competibacteraceae bacterium]
MARHPVCNEGDIPVGGMKACKVGGGVVVVVFHLDDGFYATQNDCTHLFASLHKGRIVEGHQIECPHHRTRFDIRTGEVVCWANHPPGVQLLNFLRAKKALKTYPVTVDAGQVFVEA